MDQTGDRHERCEVIMRQNSFPLALLLSLFTLVGGVIPRSTGAADLPDAAAILERIDQNMVFETRTATLTMTVVNGGRTRSYSIQSYGRGEHDSAMEYVSPPRDKGTRMLKLGDDMWTYLPSIDRVQKISGHMLRQGMMGSDLSYEDMMTSSAMRQRYSAKVTGQETIDGRPCYKLEMIAKDAAVTYPKRVTWIDTASYIPLKQELYALSGMLLKTWTMSGIKEFPGKRQFPTHMEVKDALKKDSRTVIDFTNMTFGVDLEQEVFSMRWLERK